MVDESVERGETGAAGATAVAESGRGRRCWGSHARAVEAGRGRMEADRGGGALA